jgi:hypothetical protein
MNEKSHSFFSCSLLKLSLHDIGYVSYWDHYGLVMDILSWLQRVKSVCSRGALARMSARGVCLSVLRRMHYQRKIQPGCIRNLAKHSKYKLF